MNKKIELMKSNKNMYVDNSKKFLVDKNHHPEYTLVYTLYTINMKL